MYSYKGLKSIKDKNIEVLSFISDNTLKIFYSDSSNAICIDGEYFTLTDVINAKRGVSPIFINDLVAKVNGTIKYIHGAKWGEIAAKNGITNDYKHGFEIVIPL